MSLLDTKIFFSIQVRQQKHIVPLTDRNQATPRGSLCWGQVLQVQTCWKQKAVLQSSPAHRQWHRCQGHSMTPLSLRMGVSSSEKLGPHFSLCQVPCVSEDAELLLLPPERHKHSGNLRLQKDLDNLSCLDHMCVHTVQGITHCQLAAAH